MVQLIFIISGLSVCLGYVLAMAVGRRTSKPAEVDDEAAAIKEVWQNEQLQVDPDEVRELVESLKGLTATVDSNVDRHSTRVAEISDELVKDNPNESSLVLVAATRLLDANQQLQQDLESANQEIVIQQKQIDSAINEARTDSLTGLANRRALDLDMKRLFALRRRQGTTLSLALLDIDHFKRFNDYHGHQVGDETLKGVARIIEDTMREMDFVARYGGEEFAIVMPDTNLEDAKAAAERLRDIIANSPIEADGAELHVTASVGVTEVCGEDDIKNLIRRADEALYAAKAAGRNCTFHHDGERPQPLEPSSEPLELEAATAAV